MDHTEETRENLIQVDLRKIMEDSFLDYSMSVIVSRENLGELIFRWMK